MWVLVRALGNTQNGVSSNVLGFDQQHDMTFKKNNGDCWSEDRGSRTRIKLRLFRNRGSYERHLKIFYNLVYINLIL